MGIPALLAVPVWTILLTQLHLRVCLVAPASWKAAIDCQGLPALLICREQQT